MLHVFEQPPRAMRAPERERELKNACTALALRASGRTSNDPGILLGSNFKILRNVILQDCREFTAVWSKSSKSLISYEDGKIYFDKFQKCYSCLTTHPKHLYNLSRQFQADKIEDCLLCKCPLENVLPQASDHKPSLLALTANNWLYRLSADTGEVLQKVYLSPHFKFRTLDWSVTQETVYVKTIQHKQSRLAQQAGVDNTILFHLAIFRVFPLGVVGLLEISKKVFGRTVIDVILSQGVLAVSHSSKCVKLYSFEYIVQKFMTTELILGQQCDLFGARGVVGETPFGIPVNIQIKECPPVLFEMSYFGNGVQIGGHPFHYIYTPKDKRYAGTHHICAIRDGTLAKNGVQDMDCDSLEEDWIFFHPDESGRIIHAGPSTINVLKIREETGFDFHCEVVRDFSIFASRGNVCPDVMVTSSGRTVKRRFQQLDDDPEQETFRIVKYEDELDLLAIVDVSQTEYEGQATLRLHDNKTGSLMKRIALKDKWDVTYSNEIYFDRDTVIHIRQEKSNYTCTVYKLNIWKDEDPKTRR